MAIDASAFVVLGLQPGADSAAIERAYKRLIKEHHPDREGGDARRAAEITQAYRELRSARPKDALEMHEEAVETQGRRARVILALGLAAGVAALLLATGPIMSAVEGLWPAAAKPLRAPGSGASAIDAIDQPLTLNAIDQAVRDARKLAAEGDEMSLAAVSRHCHQQLRS